MNEYKADISLRVTHPTMAPDAICSLLGLTADVKRSVGAARTNPIGKQLPGFWTETYCGFDIECHGGESMPECLRRTLTDLSERAPAFDEIRASGGSIQIYVLATPKESTFGERIPWDLMQQLASLGIDLSLEIY